MRRCTVFLLIIGNAWAQTGLDKIVLKDGAEYLGEYLKIEKNKVYFKPSEGFMIQGGDPNTKGNNKAMNGLGGNAGKFLNT
ncbi:MAG: hypothetical protein ACJZ1R_06540 [Candidatus Neomarinimicrobiota bacterium]